MSTLFLPNGPLRIAVVIAESVAVESPCSKSKRGVAIYTNTTNAVPLVVAVGCNKPPRDLPCLENQACRDACGRLCMHAEANALLGLPSGGAKSTLEVVHVKVVDGVLVASGGPSCSPCARDMYDDPRIAAVWLYHVDGWKRYPIEEFYTLSMQANNLPELT